MFSVCKGATRQKVHGNVEALQETKHNGRSGGPDWRMLVSTLAKDQRTWVCRLAVDWKTGTGLVGSSNPDQRTAVVRSASDLRTLVGGSDPDWRTLIGGSALDWRTLVLTSGSFVRGTTTNWGTQMGGESGAHRGWRVTGCEAESPGCRMAGPPWRRVALLPLHWAAIGQESWAAVEQALAGS